MRDLIHKLGWLPKDHLVLVQTERGYALERMHVCISHVRTKHGNRMLVPTWAAELFDDLGYSEHYMIDWLAHVSAQSPELVTAAMSSYELGGVNALSDFLTSAVGRAQPIALP